ncbi:MAG: ankyrin repeat domain-containing protein [Candidatus Aquirickettsiella sp.]
MFKRFNKTPRLKNIASYQTNKNEDSLFSAVKSNDLEKISYFIDQGIDVNAYDKLGYSALHYLASEEALDLLMKNNADVFAKRVDIKNNFNAIANTPPLSSACFFMRYHLVDPILQYYSLSDLEEKPQYVRNNKVLSLIWDSIYQGKQDLQALSLGTIQPLEQKGLASDELVTIDVRPEDLFLAIKTNNLEKFKQLLAQEADIHVSEGNNTLLSLAMSRHGYPFLTPIFLHSSSNLNKEPPDYIKKNYLLVSLWEACRRNKLSSQLITGSAIPIETSQIYRKRNQFFADLWQKYKQHCQGASCAKLAQVGILIQDFRL